MGLSLRHTVYNKTGIMEIGLRSKEYCGIYIKKSIRKNPRNWEPPPYFLKLVNYVNQSTTEELIIVKMSTIV